MSGGARAVGPAAGGCWQSLAEMVTVVVISRNRRQALLETLSRHEAPVILVDNASRDGTVRAVLESFPSVRVIPLRRNAGAAARNLGVRLAATPYVAFADDDSWWAPGALDRAVRHLSTDGGIALLAARVLVGEDDRLDPVAAAMAASPLGRRPGSAGPDVLGFMACAAVVDRKAFLAAGGFDPVVHFPGEEERLAIDLAAAGWRLVYAEDVVVHHRPAPGRSSRRRRAELIARNSLLTAAMRRPWPVVCRMAFGQMRAGGPEQVGAMKALPRIPAALVRRRRVPGRIEAQLRLLTGVAPVGRPGARISPDDADLDGRSVNRPVEEGRRGAAGAKSASG
jgi:GT2 family glycosyltransferase